MEIGKLPNEVLRALILDKIRNSRDEILIEPAVGEDCSAKIRNMSYVSFLPIRSRN